MKNDSIFSDSISIWKSFQSNWLFYKIYMISRLCASWWILWRCAIPEPYILGELRHNTTSLGWSGAWLLFPLEKCCLNELKFCKVSRNPKSNSCWKFQLSILTNKKVLFLKKIWSVPCTMDSSFFSQEMSYCVLTLLVYMALFFSIRKISFIRDLSSES